jgi:hypothetical protein
MNVIGLFIDETELEPASQQLIFVTEFQMTARTGFRSANLFTEK